MRPLLGTPLASRQRMLTDDSLRGRVVLSSDGVVIGEIHRLVIRPTDWHVQALEVKLRREAADLTGTHRSLFHSATIEIATEHVQSTGDAVILSVPVHALRQPTPTEAAQPTAPA